ncbi:MAG: hypothetical protein ACJA2S_002149 [Cyclobacteriaceae bacterium]|jgi:hypothetical protein
MRILLTFLLLSLDIQMALACECPPTNEETVKRNFEEAEIIVIGHAIKNVNYDVEVRNSWNKRNQGYEVLFKVDSVLKGDKNLRDVIVTQLLSGGCSRRFEFGESMIISGSSISKIINRTPKRPKPKGSEIPPTEMPPLTPEYSSGSTLFLYNSEQEEADYWNELAQNNKVIPSSLYNSYYVDSTAGSYFLK